MLVDVLDTDKVPKMDTDMDMDTDVDMDNFQVVPVS
jgi:hypothetical protein